MFARALPSLFTVGNLFLGMISMIFAIEGEWRYAAILVIIGMLLDGLDGRVARMLNTQSEFGKELDSLADVISFGAAPAIIVYIAVFRDFGPEGWFITALFPICGALRLARFNVKPGKKGYFIGLPITAAGGLLATMSLYHVHLHHVWVMIGTAILSLLMVSNIKYPAFKKINMSKSTYILMAVLLIIVTAVGWSFPDQLPKLIFVPLAVYALYGVAKNFDKRSSPDENEEPVEDLK